MRSWWCAVILVVLGGCTPTAFTVATLAASGATYVATGKSVSDITLSAMADMDCALVRLARGEPICRRTPAEAPAVTTTLAHAGAGRAFNPGPPRRSERLDPGVAPAGEAAGRLGPAPDRSADRAAERDGLYLVSDGAPAVVTTVAALRSRTAVLEGFSAASETFGLVQDDGTLEVFVHDRTVRGAEPDLRLVFVVRGYARDPDAFAGLWLNGAFHLIGTILA